MQPHSCTAARRQAQPVGGKLLSLQRPAGPVGQQRLHPSCPRLDTGVADQAAVGPHRIGVGSGGVAVAQVEAGAGEQPARSARHEVQLARLRGTRRPVQELVREPAQMPGPRHHRSRRLHGELPRQRKELVMQPVHRDRVDPCDGEAVGVLAGLCGGG